ncbi:MAG: tetratricopeptide repeat protein [Treponema sp.]
MNKPLVFTAVMLCAPFFLSAERPIVTDIQAAAGKGTKINISWVPPLGGAEEISKLLVFRSTKPVSASYDLIGLTPAAELDAKTTGWVDSVNTYSEYFYAVIAESGGKRHNIVLPSINATVTGVRLPFPKKKTTEPQSASAKEKIYDNNLRSMRETPLPLLEINGIPAKKKVKMSAKSKAAAKSLAAGGVKRRAEPLSFYVFEEDLISPDGGDDFLLFEILRKYFIQKDYAQSARALEKLLGTNLTHTVEARARFYLAESHYFCEDYEKAAINFVALYGDFPVLSKKWIDSSFDLMPLPESQ